MLRTLFTVGVMALLGLFLLKFVFGLFAGFVGLMFILLGFALKILVVGVIVYFVIRIVSPGTARKITEAFSGRPGN